MNPHYPLVARRANHRCEYCHAPEVAFNFPFEVEHPVPKSQGGSDEHSNHALSCRSCNLYKSDTSRALDPVSREFVQLFNPRFDRWNEHFSVDPGAVEIAGLTAKARATIESLRMNSPLQRAARQQWVLLELFP